MMFRGTILMSLAAGLIVINANSVLAASSQGIQTARIMGFINVRDFGAVGDGKTDDTAAIRAAIASLPKFTRRNPFGLKPIFFPNGIYLVSDTLKRLEGDVQYAPGLAFFGETKAGVTLRLKDNAPGFGDARRPRPVLYFASGLMRGGSPSAGGKDYSSLGEGNDAYQNYVESMTIDTGHNNPGATGIDYLASNIGAIRGVRLVAPAGTGVVGISLTRKWIGPALLKDISIEGFSTGIDIANTEYSVVLDGVQISGSREYGIRNTSNSVSFSNLQISTVDGVAIGNFTPQALLVGRDARLGSGSASGILNQGYMNLTEVYSVAPVLGHGLPKETAGRPIRLDGVFSPSGKMGEPAWTLPVKPAPSFPDTSVRDWADVTKYGAVAGAHHDSSVAIQAAMDSGRPVICFPNGIYRITTPINIPPTVQRIEGSFSTVYLDFRTAGNDDNKINQELAESGFVIGARELPLFLRRVVVRNDINVTSNKAKIAFLYSGAGAFVLADDVVGEMVAIKRLSSGGEIWGENVIGGKFSFEGRKGVWFRQLNTEGKGVRILNEGARLWVLGTKTENNMTLLQNSGGAISEMFGGLAYMVHSDGKKVPYLRNLAGRITAAFAEEAFFPDAIYETILESDNAGKILRIQGNSMPERHHSAHIVPQVSTDSAAAVQ